MQILNVQLPLNAKEVEENFQRLFEINDKSRGGSLYLQSKVTAIVSFESLVPAGLGVFHLIFFTNQFRIASVHNVL